MKKLLLTILIGIGVLLGVIFVAAYFQKQGKQTFINEKREGKVDVLIGESVIYLELADTPEKRAMGLSAKPKIPMDEGMLFSFEQKDVIPQFWMKGMLIPLDFIWINDNKIVQINENVQPPKGEDDIITITPNAAVDYVIEANAGYLLKNDIKIGDAVKINF